MLLERQQPPQSRRSTLAIDQPTRAAREPFAVCSTGLAKGLAKGLANRTAFPTPDWPTE